MVAYPIRIERDGYRGANPRLREKAREKNLIAAIIERKINEMILNQKERIRVYKYHEIARETGYSTDIISDLCYSIECSHYGFTAVRHDIPEE